MSSKENTEGLQHDEDVEAHKKRAASEGAPEEPGSTPESRGDFDDDAVEAHRKRV